MNPMTLDDEQTLYDILDLKPDAGSQEIREAYLRTKAAYNKDSVALYSLITKEEREEMLRKIEEAYHILSNPTKRKEYDQNHGLLDPDDEPLDFIRLPNHRKIISIDRVPPMEGSLDEDALLVPPSTDFTSSRPTPKWPTANEDSNIFSEQLPKPVIEETPQPQIQSQVKVQVQPQAPTVQFQFTTITSGVVSQPVQVQTPEATLAQTSAPASTSNQPLTLVQEIEIETEWKGSFLRRIRESKRLSIEEMSAITKITRSYLQAVEEDNFQKLPAAVYVRGFITQVAKVLRLSPEKVTSAYMSRYFQARPEQTR